MNAIDSHTIPSATVVPESHLAVLSASEVNDLCAAQSGPVYERFRRCALAVLTSGIDSDDAAAVFDVFSDFAVRFERADRGIVVQLENAPAYAFVDGNMIAGARDHLFAVLRDIVFVTNDIAALDLDESRPADVTEIVFRVLRHAGLMRPGPQRGLVVCWGGHSIGSGEYDYTKELGYQLGLRHLDVCTGCGPGAMKGPMKGATIAHAKQRIRNGRYIGLTEPGIIAAEAPNAIVNHLCILPDIEKRLEAFVRLAHAIVVFPGGAGTAEEILYLLGILADPANDALPFPLVLTGPPESEAYFTALDDFVRATLGPGFARRYEIAIGDPAAVAARLRRDVDDVLAYREAVDDAPYFNWSLAIDHRFQSPFDVTHDTMNALELKRSLPPHELASNLRRAFSGIVAGNVKEAGVRAVRANGPFELRADPGIASALDSMLRSFVDGQRMRLPGQEYTPSYRVVG